jgi:hypothetical protein
MRRVNYRRAVRLLRGRATSLTLLAIYVMTAAGVPLPSGNHVHKSGELFPCASCPCGCATAEQCWRSCCCHSLAERMAWAREHGVRPPEYAITAAMRGGIDVAWLKCQLETPPSPALAAAREGVGKQLVARTCCHCRAEQSAERHEVKATSRVIAWRALDCKGQSSNWLAAVPTWLDQAQSFSNDLHLIQWLGPAGSDQVARAGDLPTTPPPERA